MLRADVKSHHEQFKCSNARQPAPACGVYRRRLVLLVVCPYLNTGSYYDGSGQALPEVVEEFGASVATQVDRRLFLREKGQPIRAFELQHIHFILY